MHARAYSLSTQRLLLRFVPGQNPSEGRGGQESLKMVLRFREGGACEGGSPARPAAWEGGPGGGGHGGHTRGRECQP